MCICYCMILLYLEGSGCKFQSVSTKTSQFCPFFGVQELRKKHVNTKNSQFSTFFGFQELRKNMYIYKYVHMYITWFCYIWRVVVLSFSPSTPKLVNFANFLESRSWGKNMSTPKRVNFPHFFDSRSWEKTCIYNIYMYICYCMILLYLEGSGSKFHSVSTKTSQFSPFFGFQELRKKHVNTKTSQFSHFLDSRSWEKICQHQTSQFSSFLRFQELRKTCIYIHTYNMYI